MTRSLLLLLLLAQERANNTPAPGEFEADSRQVYDLCSPDQIASFEGARVEWGHYIQWKTINGRMTGAGTFVAAPWNTCLESPEYTALEWNGQGKLRFQVRGAGDGAPKGRNLPGAWSDWIPLEGDGNRLPIPRSIQGMQWIQVKGELGTESRLSEFSIHKKMMLPDHPRIILTPRRVRDVTERIARNPELKKIYDVYIGYMKRHSQEDWVRNNTNTWTAGWHMVSLGMAWNFSKDPVFLEEARKQLDRIESPWAKNLSHFENPQLLSGAGILIDHVWSGLSEAERRRYAIALLFLADKQQERWRFSDVSNQIYTNSGKNLITGLALAGAGVQPEKEAFYLRQAEDMIRNHLIPGSNFWSSDDGGWGEGHDYCSFTQVDWAFEAHAWASASGEDLFQKANFFKFLSQWRTYEKRYNGLESKFCDSRHGNTSLPFPEFVASRWRDRIAQKQARQAIATAMSKPGDVSLTHLWQAVLWFDPDLPAATDEGYPESMPLGRHFGGVGQVVARSGWGPEDVVAVFKSGNAYTPGTHYHADENSFVIDRGGSLAIDSGAYDGAIPHYGAYFTRSVAHNTVTVTKPGERFRGPGNDGGQIGGTWMQLEGQQYDSSQYGMHLRPPLQLDGVVAFETNARYTYAAGDATRAYSADKLSRFTRQFVHLQPDIILVFDRITSSDPGYEKRWLLHSIDEPELRGTTAVVSHLKGKLFSQTLLPADARVTKLGGPGKEFFSDGQNYPLKDTHGDKETGSWRIEVFPGGPRKDDAFLHYMYVTDATATSAPKATLSDSADRCVVQVTSGARSFVVTFNKTGVLGGHVRIDGAGASLTQDLTSKVQPQRFDTEEIWK